MGDAVPHGRTAGVDAQQSGLRERPQELGLPVDTGWVWAPKNSAGNAVRFAELEAKLVNVHGRVKSFYASNNPDLLGHVTLYDPVIERMKVTQALRGALYHDELHFDHIKELTRKLKG